MFYYTKYSFSGTDKTNNLTCEIICDNVTCKNYRFLTTHHSQLIWIFYIARQDCYLYKKYIDACKFQTYFPR